MNAALKSWIKKFVLVLAALLLVFSLTTPIAFAQNNDDLGEEANNNINSTVEACNEGTGGIGIVVCPVVNLLVSGITRLTLGGGGQEDGQRKSPLISFLAISPPRASINGESTPLANIVNNVVTIANSIYILVFLVLIFGSSLPFFSAQNYTIKKTLPKLIIAVILTQFTLPITGLIIDFFNLLGYAIPNVLLALGQIPETTTGSGDTASKVGAGVGVGISAGLGAAGIVSAGFGWIFIVGFLLAGLIAVIVGLVYMIIRYFLIYVMILIAPLAFVAWVIPGTEKFFKQWWTDFIRLNAMFVTIMALLSASVVISAALTAQNAADSTPLSILPAVMPIVALFLIPKTLKATTKGLSAISGGVLGAAGAATGKVTGAAKTKGKEATKAQFQETRNVAAAKAFGKNSTGGRVRGALFQGKLPTAKGQFEASKNVANYNAEQRKQANESLQFQGSNLDFKEYQKELRNIAKGKGSKVLKASSGDRNVQIAAGNILAQQGDVEHIRAMLNGGTVDAGTVDEVTYSPGTINDKTLGEMIQPSYGDIKSAAPDLASGGNPKAFEGLSAEKIANLDATSIKEMSKHHDPGGGGAAKSLELQKQLSLLRQDPNLRNKLSQKQIDALNADSRGVRF